jgi:5-hydroxyisourate hydrolase / 2-oxo-4-hydroxy-4-carboxy-5-ureidoimidazoline decarboxylase
MSQITTHILDTSTGKPAQGIHIRLEKDGNIIAEGVTNVDGRIGDLLPNDKILEVGNYEMIFDTGSYFARQNIKGFYPKVVIHFTIFDESHYHVPLLLNPFGYSTYRGS